MYSFHVKQVVTAEVVIRVSGGEEEVARVDGRTELIFGLHHTPDDLVEDSYTMVDFILTTFSDDHYSFTCVH